MNELYGDQLGSNRSIANTLLNITGDCPGQGRRSREDAIRRGAGGLLNQILGDDKEKEDEAEDKNEDTEKESAEEKIIKESEKVLDLFRRR
jgi:hypothetical protein